MKSTGMLILVLFSAIGAGAQDCGGHGTRESMVVSTGWVESHLKDPDLVLLAIGTLADYQKAHIPGSAYLDFAEIRANSPLQTELRPMPELVAAFQKVGVSNRSRIILYVLKDQLSILGRVYLTLDTVGLAARTSLMDGGLPVWVAEKRASSSDAPTVKPGNIEPCAQNDVVTRMDYVQANLRKPGVTIVDSRLPQFYAGEAPSMGKAGRIPGAVSVPFDSLVDEGGKLKSVSQLQSQFRAAGVKDGDRVVSYCHVGQQASFVYFVARYLGFDARMYDGSWDEWSKHPELPVEAAAK